MIGNKIVDNITSISKKSNKELPNNDEKEEDMEITTHKKNIYIYIYITRRKTKNYWWIKIST